MILDTDILSEFLKGYNATVAERAARYAKDHGGFHVHQRHRFRNHLWPRIQGHLTGAQRFLEFFTVNIRNANTRAAYARAARHVSAIV